MQKIRMLLKSIFEEAVNDDLISKNPMRRLPVPDTPDPDKPVLEKVDAAGVLVQPEMEKRRSPLLSIPPFGRGFSRHGVFRSDGVWAAQERMLTPPRSSPR